MPAYGEAAMEKRAYEAELEEREYWDRAEAVRAQIGDTAATRLLQFMPHGALRTGGPVTPRAPEAVVKALVEFGVAEMTDGRARLTFGGKYVLLYLGKQIRGEGMYEIGTVRL